MYTKTFAFIIFTLWSCVPARDNSSSLGSSPFKDLPESITPIRFANNNLALVATPSNQDKNWDMFLLFEVYNPNPACPAYKSVRFEENLAYYKAGVYLRQLASSKVGQSISNLISIFGRPSGPNTEFSKSASWPIPILIASPMNGEPVRVVRIAANISSDGIITSTNAMGAYICPINNLDSLRIIR